jgi:DNA-binding response OmpR family regulator
MPRILVVDDDPTNQRMLGYSLRKVGYVVIPAENGEVGWDLLHKETIDLAIIDLSMPILDGLSLLRLIRSKKQWVGLPVIILTASGDDRELDIAREIGIQAFLTKPSGSRILLETVSTALHASKHPSIGE